MRTLMLTPAMAPHRVIPWQRAIVLSFLGKVEVVAEYDEIIRSQALAVRAPAVVRLTRGHVPVRRTVRFSRLNVFTRDAFRCQYCGARRAMRELTYDHVVPRARGGPTDWTNIVTACRACNDRKGGRTPEEAHMRLLSKPVKPSWLPATTALQVDPATVPAPWQVFCA